MNDVTVEVASSSALLGRSETRPVVLIGAGTGMGDLGEWLAPGQGGLTRASSILVTDAIGGRWLADPPRALAGRLIVACPVPSWIGAGGTAALRAARILIEALKSAGRELDRDAFIKAMEAIVSEGDDGSPPIAFGPGRRVGLSGSVILRLRSDGRSYELISPRIDPGPAADDWQREVRRGVP
jgi:hypothetical protein